MQLADNDLVTMRPVDASDIGAIVANLRHADALELNAVTGWPIEQSVAYCAGVDGARVLLIGGEVAALWGVNTMLATPEQGMPWLIGTTAIVKHPAPFLRASKRIFAWVMMNHEYLSNYVDVRHAEAIRWLRWLGFDILPAVRYGAYSMMFHPFEWKK